MKSHFELTDNVVVVTGGAGLIGQSFAHAICDAAGTCIIADVNDAAAEDARAAVLKRNPAANVDSVNMDICSPSSIEAAIAYLDKKYGRIDALVNNAYPRNKNYGKNFFEVEYADFCENISLNLGGYFQTSKSFAQYFYTQGHGNIVNVASVYGVIAPRFEIYDNTAMTMPVEYAAIKSGVIQLTQYMAKYFKGRRIRVNALSPGGILDGQDKQFVAAYAAYCVNKGMLEKSDLSGGLVFLLSDSSEFVNGHNLVIDDGFTL